LPTGPQILQIQHLENRPFIFQNSMSTATIPQCPTNDRTMRTVTVQQCTL